MIPTTTITKDSFKQGRSLRCKTPAGREVVIRPPNLEQHALSGGLPMRLKQVAARGVQEIDKLLEEIDVEGDAEMLTYLDGLVASTFVEPEFERPVWEIVNVDENGVPTEDEEEVRAQTVVQTKGDRLDDYLLPAEYRWALLVAFGEQDEDGEGNLLWGRPPLSRFSPFPEEHGCAPDCEACERARDRVTLAHAYFRSTRTGALS